jgi:hypothetical protein
MKTIRTTMKTIKFLIVMALFIGFTSCDNDDDGPTLVQVESKKVENLFAPQQGGQGEPVSGEFTKFDFASGQITTSDTDWDIAFRGTSVIINGGVSSGTTDEPNRTKEAGAYIASGTMATVTEVTTSSFAQDAADGFAIPTGSGNGWYNYTGSPDHLILPIAGKILVIKTRDGKYAKVEVLSYYKGAPAEPNVITGTDESKYYTFNYVYQPNDGVTTF